MTSVAPWYIIILTMTIRKSGIGMGTIWAATALRTMLGSAVPGIGNLIGAVAGLLIGATVFFFDDIVTTIKDVFYVVVSEFINGISIIINDIGNFFSWLFGFKKF